MCLKARETGRREGACSFRNDNQERKSLAVFKYIKQKVVVYYETIFSIGFISIVNF